MNCIGPLTPEDFELLAYADGVATPEVAAHISTCDGCRRRADELQREQSIWQAALHRAGCPSGIELGEHHLRLLPPERAAAVDQHLALCRACAREVAALGEFLAQAGESRLAEGLAQAEGALRTLTARLTGMSAGPGEGTLRFQPMALRELRGPHTGDTPPLTFDAENFLVTLEFWPEPGAATRHLVGLVAGADGFAGAEVELSDAEGDRRVSPIDELGSFSLTGISPGAHRLLVKLPAAGAQVQTDEFAVN
jgi:anti-sigma factor RsiW